MTAATLSSYKENVRARSNRRERSTLEPTVDRSAINDLEELDEVFGVNGVEAKLVLVSFMEATVESGIEVAAVNRKGL